MSAIIGRIEFSGQPVAADSFARALDSLACYAADGTGSDVTGPVAMGHHALLVDRRAVQEAQPIRLGPLILVADAILDNRDELQKKIAPTEPPLSDGALILRAYRKWGEDCARHLLGDFAFVIHDTEKGSSFLARDHLGTRPLYWARKGQTLLFATDMRGITAFDDFEWTLDQGTVARYLYNSQEPLSASFFQDARILQAGCHLTVDAEGARETRWWDPAAAPDVRYSKTDDYIQHLRELLERSVFDRTQTDYPVGSHLSGGIDSSTVTLLAATALKERSRSLAACYTWSPAVSEQYPDMGERDERRIIARIAEEHGFPVRNTASDEASLNELLSMSMAYYGTADLNEELPIIDQAQKDGIRVMLSGWGGDEAFSAFGFGRLAQLLRQGRLFGAFHTAKAYTGGSIRPWKLLQVLWNFGVLPSMPDRFVLRHSVFVSPVQDRNIGDTSFMRQHLPAEPLMLRMVPNVKAYSARMLLWGHIGNRAASWSTWSSNSHLQYRYPLIERRLVEFLLGLPPGIHMHDGRPRYPARAAIRDIFVPPRSKVDKANTVLRKANAVKGWQKIVADFAGDHPPTIPDCIDKEFFENITQDCPRNIDELDLKKFGDLLDAMRIVRLYEAF